MTAIYTYIFAAIFVCVGFAHAEVMDKEPSLLTNYFWGLSGAILCFLLARYKPNILLLTGSISLFYFYGLLAELRDPYVGPAILREAGGFYAVSGYLLAILVIVSVVAGLIMRKKNEKRP